MRKTAVTYLCFILAMSLFVTLRVYAGHELSKEPAKKEAVTEGTAAEETLASVQEKAQTTPEPVEEEPEDDFLPADDGNEYMWHGPIDPKEEFEGLLPRIVCWGDSLTVSVDEKTAFPDIVRSLSGCEVINYGVESESASMIAMREGGLRVNVKATVIPADTTLIPIFLRTENNGNVHFLDNGDGGVNPCVISGIEGELKKLNGSYYFVRNRKGERIAVEEGTQFKTHGMIDARMGDVLVIFAGTNDLPDKSSVKNIISLEKSMLDAAKCDKYIIVGLTYAGGIPDIEAVNDALAKEFGDHFVDIRKYMLNYGLADAGIDMTPSDKDDIKKGEIPGSLRSDYVHGNKLYHKLLGEQVYRRLQYLGYVPLSNEEDI